MPYAKKPVTTEAVFGMIKPGVTYSPYNISRSLGALSADVKKILYELAAEGKLKTVRPHKHTCFMLPNTEHLRRCAKPQPVVDPATVAQPRTFAVLTGEIRRYDAEIARRQELCMMTRER